MRLGETVTRIDPGGGVVTPNGTWHAPLTFDARPAAPKLGRGDVTLLQQFVGRQVRLDRDLFDPSTVTLMDFSHPVAGPEDIGFIYVLPLGRREALVEATVMSPRTVDGETLDAAVLSYLNKLGVGRDEAIGATVYQERGTLPMTTARHEPRSSKTVLRIGAAARVGQALDRLRLPRHAAGGARLGRPDRKRPAADPAAAGGGRGGRRFWTACSCRTCAAGRATRRLLFFRLFERAPPRSLVRFLNDGASPLDAARVIAAMPKPPFVAEAVRSWRTWMKR